MLRCTYLRADPVPERDLYGRAVGGRRRGTRLALCQQPWSGHQRLFCRSRCLRALGRSQFRLPGRKTRGMAARMAMGTPPTIQLAPFSQSIVAPFAAFKLDTPRSARSSRAPGEGVSPRLSPRASRPSTAASRPGTSSSARSSNRLLEYGQKHLFSPSAAAFQIQWWRRQAGHFPLCHLP